MATFLVFISSAFLFVLYHNANVTLAMHDTYPWQDNPFKVDPNYHPYYPYHVNPEHNQLPVETPQQDVAPRRLPFDPTQQDVAPRRLPFDPTTQDAAAQPQQESYRQQESVIANDGKTCSTCGKTFSRASDCRRHERIHSNLRPFECDFAGCGADFNRLDKLNEHKLLHNPSTTAHICEICNMDLITRSRLQAHFSTRKHKQKVQEMNQG